MKEKNKNLFYLVLVISLLLLIPQIIKISQGDNLFLSGETYYNVRLIEQGRTTQMFGWDSLQERPVQFNLFHYFLAFIPLTVSFMTYLFPFILGLLSVLLAYFLFKKFGLDEDTSIYSTILFCTVPVYLYTFTNFNPVTLALPLVLGGILLFLKKSFYSYLAIPLFLVLGFVSTPISIMVLLFLLVYSFFIDRNKYYGYVSLATSFLFVASWLSAYFLDFFTLKVIPSVSNIDGLLLEFGSTNGYSVITLGLAVIGLAAWWKRDFKNNLIILSLITTIFFSFIYSDLVILGAFFASFMGGIAINTLINRDWELEELKDFTLLLVLCIIIFSTIVLLNNEIRFIDKQEHKAINYLSATHPKDIILSTEEKGFLIQQITNRKTFLDEKSWQYYDYETRVNIVEKIFYSRNLEELESLLFDNKINHIFINQDMRNGQVWVGREEGLLFFLDNTDIFVKLYDDGYNQIYRYVRKN